MNVTVTIHSLRSVICWSTNLSASGSATSLSSAIPSRSAVQCHIVASLGQGMRYGMRYVVPVWFDVLNIELLRKEELSRYSPAWVLISRILHTRNVCAKQLNRLRRECPWMTTRSACLGGVSGSGRSGERRRLRGERWDGREKQLQIIVGWGGKGIGRWWMNRIGVGVDDEGRAVFERVRWWWGGVH